MEVANLTAKLSVDTREFTRGIDKAEKSLTDLDGATAGAGQSAGVMGTKFKGAALAMGALAGGVVATKTIQFLKGATTAASDLSESVNAVQKVFGDAAPTILQFGKSSAESVGLANSSFNQMATLTGALLTNFGFAAQDAADETINLTTRAADLASVFNTDVSDALGAINSALRGETEPIRRYAIDVSEASLAQEALAQGITTSVSAMSQQEKAALRLDAIMRQSASSAGDFAETSGGLANQSRIMAEQWEDAKAALGEGLIPVAVKATAVLADMAEAVPGVIRGFELGVQAIDRWTGKAGEYITLGLVQTWSDEDEALYHFSKTLDYAVEQLRDGVDAGKLTRDWMAHLASQGALTADVMKRVQEVTGVTDETMKLAAQSGYDLRDSYNLSAEAAGMLADVITSNTWAALDGARHRTGDLNSELELTHELTRRDMSVVELTKLQEQALEAYRAMQMLNGTFAYDRNLAMGATVEQRRGRAAQSGAADPYGFRGGITGPNLGFQSGGMVPGPLGAPRLAVVHGGEEVLTAQQRAERNVTVNMNGNVTSGGMMGDEIALALLMAGVNEQAEFRGLADVRG